MENLETLATLGKHGTGRRHVKHWANTAQDEDK